MKDLRKKRIKAGIAQHDLATTLGVTSRTIRNWEGGKTPVRKGYIEAINKALSI